MFKKWMPSILLAVTFAAHAQHATYTPFDQSAFKKTDDLVAFAIVGDYGQDNDDEKQVAKLLHKQDPQFVITMGDNNYPEGCWKTIDKNIGKYYSDFIGNYKGEYGKGSAVNRFFPSIGNHDWKAIDKCVYKGGLPYSSYFTLPNEGLYYDFKKGPVHFFAIDSDSHEPDGNKKGSKQYEWLKRKLKESDSCFKVVYFHHPPYSSGSHGSEKDMQWDFDELGADVVLSGHEHSYERIMRDGIAYIINGSGGAGLRDFDDKVKGSEYRYSKKHGFMMGYAHGNRMGFVFLNEKNRIKDGIMLTKDCS